MKTRTCRSQGPTQPKTFCNVIAQGSARSTRRPIRPEVKNIVERTAQEGFNHKALQQSWKNDKQTNKQASKQTNKQNQISGIKP
jgi:hypothetical protein